MGIRGFRVSRPTEVGAVLDAALAHNGAALVEATVDPNEQIRQALAREPSRTQLR